MKKLLFKHITNNIPRSNNAQIDSTLPGIFQDLSIEMLITQIEDDADFTNSIYPVDCDYNNPKWILSDENLVEYFKNESIIPDRILQHIRSGDCELLINFSEDAFAHRKWLLALYDLAKEFSFSPKQLRYMTSELNAKCIHEELCKELNILDQIDIIIFPYFEYAFKYKNQVFAPANVELEKKFISLNQIIKPSRVLLEYFIRSKDIQHEFFYSSPRIFGKRTNAKHDRKEIYEHLLENIRWGHFKITDIDIRQDEIDYVNNLGVVELDKGVKGAFNSDNQIDWFYNRSLFNVCTETFFIDYTICNKIVLPLKFITEKSYKIFHYYQLPLIIGYQGIIADLRNQGYDMFDDIIDHSYDDIRQHDKRFNAFIAEIARINETYSLAVCNKFKTKFQSRLESNYRKLHSPESKQLKLSYLALKGLI